MNWCARSAKNRCEKLKILCKKTKNDTSLFFERRNLHIASSSSSSSSGSGHRASSAPRSPPQGPPTLLAAPPSPSAVSTSLSPVVGAMGDPTHRRTGCWGPSHHRWRQGTEPLIAPVVVRPWETRHEVVGVDECEVGGWVSSCVRVFFSVKNELTVVNCRAVAGETTEVGGGAGRRREGQQGVGDGGERERRRGRRRGRVSASPRVFIFTPKLFNFFGPA